MSNEAFLGVEKDLKWKPIAKGKLSRLQQQDDVAIVSSESLLARVTESALQGSTKLFQLQANNPIEALKPIE
jgi:hypothetical protein